jgi:Permuted papain-like amidase enzyme, YaeF/YiiX, C92 family
MLSAGREETYWTAMLDSLNPGDVILVSGSAPIHRFVQRLTSSRWSQVGLIIYLEGHERPLFFECTSIALVPDIETDNSNSGVRTTLLESRLDSFYGTAAVRRLRPALDRSSVKKLIEFRRRVIDRPFNFSLLDSRKSMRRAHQRFSGDSYICSSLIADALQRVGVMMSPPRGPLPNNVLPGDFTVDENLVLMSGYSFEHEEIIKDV